MPSFTSTVDIMAPAPIVWDVLTDVERWGGWMPDVTSVTTQTPQRRRRRRLRPRPGSVRRSAALPR
ncbi:SRPBCC family protein [Luteococcus sp. Sow4_B9]|uniref:SRPBCC family protein n=1 Tax=Luteococcus sp. Sow4_B9 TaxID=3438792 RepID=UPI003F9C5488